MTGPTSFGSGGFSPADFGSGDAVGTNPFSFFSTRNLFVPERYVSGTALSSTATWNGATFASLGVTPGTYVWTWGIGLPNQNFTLIIGGFGVPDGASTVSLLGFGLLGLVALRRKLRC
jgi:VPDSG-CTERM motif